MDIVSRLRRFIESQNLSSTQFADIAGIARPTLSQFLTGRNKKMSSELIDKLHQSFPNLNVLWLLFGDGDMLTEGYSSFSAPKIDENPGLFEDYPLDSQQPSSPEFAEENITDFAPNRNEGAQIGISLPISTENGSSTPKRVTSIMVFYSDNSFEQFIPAK